MRNGKSLLLRIRTWVVLAMVVPSLLCVAFMAHAAPELEPTDSGAPSAMVMFPISDKPSPFGAGMRPVVFNHYVHENAIDDCESCHHTGDTVTCSSCHTVEGTEDGNFITLERAMHATDIKDRGADATTPASCVSCHTQQLLERRECAGCHTIHINAPHAETYCASCHDVTPNMTQEQFKQGVRGELSADENLALATETVYLREKNQKMSISEHEIPQKVYINGLSNKYKGNVFNHKRHYSSLVKRVAEDKLAAAFHKDPLSMCAACHHQSPLSVTPPKCVTCHTPKMDLNSSAERPALQAAYHLQCMACHDAMQVARPLNTSCTSCHKAQK